ncbi:MAG: ZIP family metal transporter [Nanoarchaeota archaeon]|nr:ZIP family metal transporter [Nanoarchaeota archaeon]MBU1644509.1 ZIP family metal transporter [Nanoarchaeota archaeon]MBU1976890.1 ZIP family metal transporter [Nanoarchaeota archaeon]
MINVALYTIISVVIVSLISLIGIISLMLNKKKLSKILLILVSLSAGSLFGGAFLHLLPEAVEEHGFTVNLSLFVLSGIITFFILEKIIHWRSQCKPEYPLVHEDKPHHIGIMNVLGDGVHNFGDGLIIAASYLVSIPVGFATTIAVVMHEIPQELADFGVLLYSGFSSKKALLFNFLSAALAIVGAVVGLILGAKSEIFMYFILPFAAGGFIYIAGSNLVPELHKVCRAKESFWHLFAMLFGVALMFLLKFLG